MKLMVPMRPLLSGNEMRVINETLAGLSAPVIAERMKVKRKTVYTYRFRAFDKLGVNSEAELFQWYTRSLCEIHGESVPADALLNPGIHQVMVTR